MAFEKIITKVVKFAYKTFAWVFFTKILVNKKTAEKILLNIKKIFETF